jgi:hypothetical protein
MVSNAFFFGIVQEHWASQLLGVQGSGNLFHEFKVRQMRLNETGHMPRQWLQSKLFQKKQNVLNLVLNKSHSVPTYPNLFSSFPFLSCFLIWKPNSCSLEHSSETKLSSICPLSFPGPGKSAQSFQTCRLVSSHLLWWLGGPLCSLLSVSGFAGLPKSLQMTRKKVPHT